MPENNDELSFEIPNDELLPLTGYEFTVTLLTGSTYTDVKTTGKFIEFDVDNEFTVQVTDPL